jgi:glycosyltransferase involved in cell wall biosynthesis
MYKVLQSCGSRSWGGLEMQALLECEQLRRGGHEVTLLCPPESRLEAEARAAGLETLSLDLRTRSYALAIATLRRFLIRRGIEIVHTQLSQDLPALVPAAVYVSQPPPIILTKRVGSFISKKDPFHRWLYRHVSLIIAISDVIRRNVIATCPVDPDRVLTLFDGVDLERFNPETVDSHAVRRELGIEEDTIVIGVVGRFSPGKGHEEFLQAARVILSQNPRVKFLIVGEPSHGEESYGNEIRRSAAPLMEKGAVIFTGFRRDIPQVMGALDILAFPSYAEAFGDVLIEAMAMKLPVVSTNCDGVLEIVVDGETGIQVPPKDAPALADGLLTLIRDPVLRKKLGEAGRLRVEKLFDLKKRTARMDELYAQILQRRVGEVFHGSRSVIQ